MIQDYLNFIISAFYPFTDILQIAGFIYVLRSLYVFIKWLFSKFCILGGRKK